MTVTDEISKTLRSLPRDSKGATLEPEADIANLRLAVEELRKAVIQLAEEIDRVPGLPVNLCPDRSAA